MVVSKYKNKAGATSSRRNLKVPMGSDTLRSPFPTLFVRHLHSFHLSFNISFIRSSQIR
jgi:hypothetical protein